MMMQIANCMRRTSHVVVRRTSYGMFTLDDSHSEKEIAPSHSSLNVKSVIRNNAI
jgi:hypothetical protein